MSSSVFAAWAPSATIISGSIVSSWLCRYGRQALISSGLGSRFPGGRDLRMLQIKTSLLFRPIALIILSSSCPALPTKGLPWASSSAPGASPTKTILASGFPSPETGFVLVEARSHFLHFATCSAIFWSFADFSAIMAAFCCEEEVWPFCMNPPVKNSFICAC